MKKDKGENNDPYKIIERQQDYLRSYKTRQDDVVIGLGALQKLLKIGANEAAATMIEDILGRDLKQARERILRWTMALQRGHVALTSTSLPLSDRIVAAATLKDLAPEAFEAEPIAPAKTLS